MRFLLFALFVLAVTRLTAAPASPWDTIAVTPDSEPARLAVADLQRCVARVTGRVPKVITLQQWNRQPIPAVVIGHSGQQTIAAAGLPLAGLGPEGYCLQSVARRNGDMYYAAAATATGVPAAIYGLLKESGYAFFLGSEAQPSRLKPLSSRPIRRSPAFRIRGVLPWYNFFNSPTTWDPVDHRALVDQLIRSGANFVGFHTYDAEPFAGVPDTNGWKWGARLLSTDSPTWGTHPMPVDQFAGGVGVLFGSPRFGAATTDPAIPSAEAILREQQVMADALTYARRRGLNACIGFEIYSNPFDDAARALFVARLHHVLRTYPAANYIWLWQPETVGVTGYRHPEGPETARQALDSAAADRRDAFRRIVETTKGESSFLLHGLDGHAARAREGARLEQYALLAYSVIRNYTNPPKLIISGWGGDERLLSAEYYEGLDKLLPKDVVFASLDHIWPRERVDAIYGELPPDRERWPIPWLELDGDQWHIQAWVHVYEPMVADAQRKGAQGILGIHWRTREVEEAFGYMMEASWRPGLTARQYFSELAAACYPASIAQEMTDIHIQLDKLGYRWIGGWGQSECAPFAWGPGEPDKVKQLRALQERLTRVTGMLKQPLPRLIWLDKQIDWTLRFDAAQQDAVHAQDLIRQAQAASDPSQRAEKAYDALAILDSGSMDAAVQAFARLITTRGEHGVLATINTKAVHAWRALRAEALQLSNGPAAIDSQAMQPQMTALQAQQVSITVPRLVTSAPAAQPLPIEVIIPGGQGGQLLARRPGTPWSRYTLTPVRGWVFRAVVPASAIQPPSIELAVIPAGASQIAWGPSGVLVYAVTPFTTRQPQSPSDRPDALQVSVAAGKQTAVVVRWKAVPGAIEYGVYRDDTLLAHTSALDFADDPDTTDARYRIEALDINGASLASGTTRFTATGTAPQPIGAMTVRPSGRSVILQWPPLPGSVRKVRLIRESVSGGEPVEIAVPSDSRLTGGRAVDQPGEGHWRYVLTPIGLNGSAGPSQEALLHFIPRDPIRQLRLPHDRNLITGQTGSVQIADTGLRVSDGYLTLDSKPAYNMAEGFRLQFSFTADTIDGMPVLFGNGIWQADGWFVQILNGQLLVRTSIGDGVGPHVRPGVRYDCTMEWTGDELVMTVNGEMRRTPAAVTPVDTTRPLFIGQYAQPSPMYQFRGTLHNLSLYAVSR